MLSSLYYSQESLMIINSLLHCFLTKKRSVLSTRVKKKQTFIDKDTLFGGNKRRIKSLFLLFVTPLYSGTPSPSLQALLIGFIRFRVPVVTSLKVPLSSHILRFISNLLFFYLEFLSRYFIGQIIHRFQFSTHISPSVES